MTRKALGRGLKALFPDGKTAEQIPLLELETDQILPSRYQPRQEIEPVKLQELARSIESQGLLQPLLVRPADGGKYELIAGERRWRAAMEAGLKKVPALVRSAAERESLELALIENIQREDLNPIEAARAFQQLINKFHLTQEEIAAQVGKERPSISNHLRLLKLPSEIQEDVSSGRLSMGHARALLSLSGKEKQLLARKTIISRSLSVRESERLVRRLAEPQATPLRKKVKKEIHIKHLEDSLRRSLGTKVIIRHHGKRGTIQIQYFSVAELDRLTEHILRKEQT